MKILDLARKAAYGLRNPNFLTAASIALFYREVGQTC